MPKIVAEQEAMAQGVWRQMLGAMHEWFKSQSCSVCSLAQVAIEKCEGLCGCDEKICRKRDGLHLSGLELLHATNQSQQGNDGKGRMDIPVGALLVEDAVAALLATDGIAALESDLGVAIAAEVVNGAVGVLEGVLRSDLETSRVVGLLRHDCDDVVSREGPFTSKCWYLAKKERASAEKWLPCLEMQSEAGACQSRQSTLLTKRKL